MQTQKSIKSERTRQHIIAKAAPVLNKKGVSGTSIAVDAHIEPESTPNVHFLLD